MKKYKRIILLIAVLILLFSYSTSAMAYEQAIRGMTIPGSGTNRVLYNQIRANTRLDMTYYSESVFNGQANMTFRLFKVDYASTTDRRSHAISFYPSDENNTPKYASFINGGGSETRLDMRASTSGSSNCIFYGKIKF